MIILPNGSCVKMSIDLDINMPKINGIEATARIKASYPDILFIGLSVNTDTDNQEKMMTAGATMLLIKGIEGVGGNGIGGRVRSSMAGVTAV